MRFENKQSGADLDDHREIKREALTSSLGRLGLGGRMMAAWARSTNFHKLSVTVEENLSLSPRVVAAWFLLTLSRARGGGTGRGEPPATGCRPRFQNRP